MTVVRWLVRIVVVIALLVAALFVGARYHDGPLGLVPGGPLTAGEIVVAPVVDWSFATDTDTIELQLDGESTSRTTWILVADGRAYIPASLSFPPGKDWYHRAQKDGRSVIRIEGRRYPVELRRVDDEATKQAVIEAVLEKYEPPPSAGDENAVMFFEVTSRPR